jgi:hypothetical protein
MLDARRSERIIEDRHAGSRATDLDEENHHDAALIGPEEVLFVQGISMDAGAPNGIAAGTSGIRVVAR